jgi:hypothetical protein
MRVASLAFGKRKALLALSLAAFVLGSQSAFAATVLESEPNGTLATADVVSVGDTVIGQLNGPGGWAENDYFVFTAPTSGTIYISFSSEGRSSEVVSQYIFTPGGQGSISPSSWQANFSFAAVAGQTYNINLVKPSGTPALYNYNLNIHY